VAASGGNLELPEPRLLVAVDTGEAEEELLEQRQTADDVVRRTQRQIGIGGVRRHGQQALRVLVRFADHLQAVELFLVDQARIVGLHPEAQGHGEQGVGIVRVDLQSPLRLLLRLLVRGKERRAQFRVGVERHPAQKPVVVQEEVGGQDALPIALLEQVARRIRGAAQGVVRVGRPPDRELPAGFPGLQFVEQVEAGVEFRHVQDRRQVLPGGRPDLTGAGQQQAAQHRRAERTGP